MNVSKVMMFSFIAVCFLLSSALAGGNMEKGKELFKSTKLGGGTSGKACNSCHPDGKGLEGVGDKSTWKVMGKKFKSLEEVSNYYIEKALQGKALDPKSEEMTDLISYVKSIKE